MSDAVRILAVALPLATAAALTFIGSWRLGRWVNAVATGLQFAVACALPWYAGAAEAHLVLLLGLVAIITGWRGLRDVPAALRARSLSRRGARLYHTGFQAFAGTQALALLAHSPMLIWLALAGSIAAIALMTGAGLAPSASAGAARIILHGSIGLTLALLGTLLLDLSAGMAGLFLVVGYGTLAGLIPLRPWPIAIAGTGGAPGAAWAIVLLPNPVLLLFARLPIESVLMMAFGLASLLFATVALWARLDWRRTVALAAMMQVGMAAFAIGLGEAVVAWVQVTALSLVLSAVHQCDGQDLLSWLALTLLPVYVLALIAGPAAVVATWSVVPVAIAVLAASAPMLGRRPVAGLAATPVWLQLVLALVLTCGLPIPAVSWFRALAG